MKTLLKSIVVIFVAGLSFLLAACGGNTQPPTRQNASATGAVGGQAAVRTLTINYFWQSLLEEEI